MGNSSSIGISRRAFLVASASVAGGLWLPLENAEAVDARGLDSSTDTVTHRRILGSWRATATGSRSESLQARE